MQMVQDAQRVLGTAAHEYTSYQNAVANELSARTADPSLRLSGSRWSLREQIRTLTNRIIGATLGERFLNDERKWEFGREVVTARYRLMAAVTDTELLAQARTFVNTARQSRFGHAYSVASSPALSEVYDRTNKVPTQIESELAELLGRLDGASIGVAGPRGAGKSTLLYGYCEDADSGADARRVINWSSVIGGKLPEQSWGDLRCMVSAPVDYVARDFVLHLFATFCGVVVGKYRAAGRSRHIYLGAFWGRRIAQLCMSFILLAAYLGSLIIIMFNSSKATMRGGSVSPIWVEIAGAGIIAAGSLIFARSAAARIRSWAREARNGRESGKAMIASARRHLSRIRYLQTRMSGRTGGLGLRPGFTAQLTRSISRSEQPLSYPEIITEFRRFAASVAADQHRRGDRVFIGVDELDKMGSAEQAEHFLNEVKGIFGIPHLYFMVSVSDDALNAFERRGLPLRDAFDSSFDEIIRVEPLSYYESRRLLYRRVIGLTEPYVALCHCLAGGLARDVIRAARQVARCAATLSVSRPGLSSSSETSSDEAAPAEYELLHGEAPQQLPALSEISAAVLHEELNRKLRSLRQVLGRTGSEDGAVLQDALYEVTAHLTVDRPMISLVDLLAQPSDAEPPEIVRLRMHLAAYVYYCATLQEVFTGALDDARMAKATSNTNDPISFDALAEARNAFAIDTSLAWNLISQCRLAWALPARNPGGGG